MKPTLSQPVDPRRAAELRAELLARREAFVTAWHPGDEGPDAALTWIAGRYVEAILSRLNQAPDKNRTAFLGLLGIERIPAQAARVPVAFKLGDQAADLTLPAGTKLAAPPPPESSDQIVFETERATGLAAAKLTQVVSLWPGRDQWLDHSAALAAGQPFTLFEKRLLEDTPHALYLAHDTLLNLKGKVSIDVRVELTQPASSPLFLAWEYWDGAVWRGFKGTNPACGEKDWLKADGTRGFTRSGRFHLEADCAETAKKKIAGVESFWIRGRLTAPLPPDPARVLPLIDELGIAVQVARPLTESAELTSAAKELGAHLIGAMGEEIKAFAISRASSAPPPADGLQPDKALFGSETLDTSKAFYPFGQAPKPGDALYLASEEVLSKPGAKVTVRVKLADNPAGRLDASAKTALTPTVAWEYWDGRAWQTLAVATDQGTFGEPESFQSSGTFRFLVPDDIEATEVHGQKGRFIRARLASGGYGFSATAKFNDGSTFTYVISKPPSLSQLRIGYTWEHGPYPAEHVLAENDFQLVDRTEEAKWPGTAFPPFTLVSGLSPALYLGFSKKLPVDRLNLFFDVVEGAAGDSGKGPALVWSYFDGIAWQRLPVEDETANLRVPGMVSLIGPEDGAPAARFGIPLHWLRAELAEDGPPGAPVLAGLYPNAVWASQWQTVVNERLGLSSGAPHQALALRQPPVLGDERIEVRELSGPRANVEWRLLAREVLGGGDRTIQELEDLLGSEGPQDEVVMGALRLKRNRDKRVSEAWVRWQGQRDLLRSGPADRHYVLDRTRGRLLFGDGEHGRVPPAGAEVLATTYRTGGGAKGNVATGTVSRLLAGVPGVDGVKNPRPAEGGADAEGPDALSSRGPRTLAHRGRALTAADYETMAREASPAVAVAHAIGGRDPYGRQRPGWVTLVLLPQSDEDRPWPSFGLRERVRRYCEARCPAGLAAAHHLHVTGPLYLPVDVAATVIPLDAATAGDAEREARAALARFLHPLAGGPERRGWTPGRDVCLSDVAAVLERVPGIDAVRELALLLDGQLQGERIAVPAGRTVVAGTIRIRVI